MNKIYKGWELLKAIADGEIKEGMKINVRTNDEMDFAVCILEYTNNRLEHIEGREIGTHEFCSSKYYFELISEPTDEIDIQGIKELNAYSDDGIELYDKIDIHDNTKKINELIKAIKQLDNQIKEKE